MKLFPRHENLEFSFVFLGASQILAYTYNTKKVNNSSLFIIYYAN